MKVGGFTVELVTADTKTPFKEHTAPDGQVYAEVEPDMDYYVSLDGNAGGIIVTISVDGVCLGYQTYFTETVKGAYKGKWERRGGRETMTALHFNKARQKYGVTANMLTGKVEVEFYRLGEMIYEENEDIVSTSLTDDSTLGGKKCIKSTTNGSHSHDITPEGRSSTSKIVNYRKGEHLRTITLNYCSALGLIHHKILPPPPESDSDDDSVQVKRGNARRKRKRSTEISSISMARVSPEGNNARQGTITVQRTYDFVDLTADD